MRLEKEKGRGSGDAAVDVRCRRRVWGCVRSRLAWVLGSSLLAWKRILGVSTFLFTSFFCPRTRTCFLFFLRTLCTRTRLCSAGFSVSQSVVFISHTKSTSATSHQPANFSYNKSTPAISHSQPR